MQTLDPSLLAISWCRVIVAAPKRQRTVDPAVSPLVSRFSSFSIQSQFSRWRCRLARGTRKFCRLFCARQVASNSV